MPERNYSLLRAMFFEKLSCGVTARSTDRSLWNESSPDFVGEVIMSVDSEHGMQISGYNGMGLASEWRAIELS